MAILEAIVLTCCLATGTPSIPDGATEILQPNNMYIEFSEELKPYLTEEQELFLKETNVPTEEVIDKVEQIEDECELKQQREKAEQELARIVAEIEEQQRLAEIEAKYQVVSDNISASISRTPSPGLNWCAKWVSMVYQNAGYGYVGGNACDMYWNYCFTSNRDELRNGMMVAVPSWNGSYMSYTYGHVGIYMDGYVWHNVGSISQTPLDEWIAAYGQISEVRWGFPFSI